jgi:hypothetical protein
MGPVEVTPGQQNQAAELRETYLPQEQDFSLLLALLLKGHGTHQSS